MRVYELVFGPMCPKTSKCSSFLPDVHSLRLLTYRPSETSYSTPIPCSVNKHAEVLGCGNSSSHLILAFLYVCRCVHPFNLRSLTLPGQGSIQDPSHMGCVWFIWDHHFRGIRVHYPRGGEAWQQATGAEQEAESSGLEPKVQRESNWKWYASLNA